MTDERVGQPNQEAGDESTLGVGVEGASVGGAPVDDDQEDSGRNAGSDAGCRMPDAAVGDQLEFGLDVEISDEELGLDPFEEDRPLTQRENRFVEEYCTNGMVGTPAARVAKYRHPHVAQYRLRKRPLIQRAIKAELARILEDGRASREAFVVRLAGLAQSNLTVVLRAIADNGGDPDRITMEDIRQLPPDLGAMIRKIKVRTLEKESVENAELVKETESFVDIELHEPKGAMELASKLQRYIGSEGDPQVNLTLDVSDMTPEQRKVEIEELLRRREGGPSIQPPFIGHSGQAGE